MKKLIGIALAVVATVALGLIAVPTMANDPAATTSVATETQTSVQTQETLQPQTQLRNQIRAMDGNGYCYEYNHENCENCPYEQEDRPLDGTGAGSANSYGYGNGGCEGCRICESENCPCEQEERPLDGTGYGAANSSGHGNCYRYDR